MPTINRGDRREQVGKLECLIILFPALREMAWICSDGKCTEKGHSGDSGTASSSWPNEAACRKECASKIEGVAWVWITVLAVICLIGLLVFIMYGKGDAGLKAIAATQILEDVGSVVSSGASHVSAALSSN